MAITIPTGCYRQPTEAEGVDSNGNKTFSYVLKGPYASLKTLLDGLSIGDEIVSGWVFSSGNLARNAGDVGTLTLTCAIDDTTTTEGETSQTPLDEIWQIRSCRNDVSILGYCGTGNTNPCREWIEAWQREPDGTIANADSFTKADGTIFPLGSEGTRGAATCELLGKIKKGIDSVMRFYPMLVKTTVYSKPPRAVYEHLAEIDTPIYSEIRKAPGNLASIISAHTWLKCQDDSEQQQDGKWRRVEAWLGANDWDINLYGTSGDRWPMPLSHQ